jgi:ribonuclease HII
LRIGLGFLTIQKRSVSFPTLEFETKLLADYSTIIAMDEVGRGSLAGPVAVGAFVFTKEQLLTMPDGLQDSKLIKESKRAAIAELARGWGTSAVEFVGPDEIDSHGIIRALKTAGQACLERLGIKDAIILLDGNQNWLELKGVITRVKADRDCASVAAASVIAKVSRDSLMSDLHEKYSQYDFASNKGYSSARHISALREFGPSEIHRKTWLSKILSDELF